MKLTTDIILYTYYIAGKMAGRNKKIDHQDIAHEAFVRMLRRTKPVPVGYECKYAKFVLLNVFLEWYTDNTPRKKDIMKGVTDEGLLDAQSQQVSPVGRAVTSELASRVAGLLCDKAHVIESIIEPWGQKRCAEALGITRANYSMRVSHAKKRLRERFAWCV